MARDYWTCPICGDNLDHGEAHSCDAEYINHIKEEKKDGSNNQN